MVEIIFVQDFYMLPSKIHGIALVHSTKFPRLVNLKQVLITIIKHGYNFIYFFLDIINIISYINN